MSLNASKINEIKLFKKLFELSLIITGLMFTSCATLKPQYGKQVSAPNSENIEVEKPAHRFFLIGDAGNADEAQSQQTLGLLKSNLDKADSASTLIFLGDNIYPKGMVSKSSKDRKVAEKKLQNQIDLAKGFKGHTLFIPGNHDWYSGIDGLTDQRNFVVEQLGKNTFLPKKGCAIDTQKVNNNITIIAIDSQWYLENWDHHKNINTDCSVKTRDDFFIEFESELNKNQNQLTIIAMHHPIMSNGVHGGQFSAIKQIFPLQSKIPLPLFGSIINLLRKTTGASPQDNQNHVYRELSNRLKTLIADRENVIFVSGHDHNLEYIEDKNLKQIISGSGSKSEAARAVNENDFSAGTQGFAILDVFNDGSSVVRFFGNNHSKQKFLFERILTKKSPISTDFKFDNIFKPTEISQIYPDKLTQKSDFYKFLFGKHYRKYYSTKVNAPDLDMSKESDGLTAIRSGGGHQSNSIRLVNSISGKEYSLRALKKSAIRFLQSLAFKEQFVADDFDRTLTEDFLLDFYTTTQPFYPFVIGELASPIHIFHTNPKLFYVQKQNNLGIYNQGFEEGLYMLEERPMNKFNDLESFGKPDNIVSSDKLFENLRKDEKYRLDEKSYIRARLFDMLIGDWDRHDDQWRWSEFKTDSGIIYKPIPRDRDQVFPKYDGLIINLLTRLPALRHMQSFGPDIRNVKWFNREPYPMDLALTASSNLDDWLNEAKFIDLNLTDELINLSFRNLPENIKDKEVVKIKNLLKVRKKKLSDFAETYFKVLRKTVVLHTTDKEDKIVVERLARGETKIQFYRNKASGEELFFENTYRHIETKNIWIYGLNGDDLFEVKGKANKPIRLKLIGGEGKNVYKIENNRNIRIYEQSDKTNETENTIGAKPYLSKDYNLNRYDYKKPGYNSYSGLPVFDYNPDDGLKAGMSFNYKVRGFKGAPYSSIHRLTAIYFFGTSGIELKYNGDFKKIAGNWNLSLDSRFTTPSYTHNFFGYGNEIKNNEEKLGMDYNRIRTQSIDFSPSLYKLGRNNGKIEIGLGFSEIKPEKTKDRISDSSTELPADVFNSTLFGKAMIRYSFSNYNNRSMPSLGMTISAEAHLETNFSKSNQTLGWLAGWLGFTHPVTKNGILNISTLAKFKTLFNDHYEFYQAASIGGNSDLRSYRFDRFIGKHSLILTSDLNLRLGKFKTPLLPVYYGIFGGYDFGRVWLKLEESNLWHQSFGGGIWFNTAQTVTSKINYFYGEDGGRISFNLIFGF